MENTYKIFLYKNGQKSTEFSQYLSLPLFLEDRLNQELDTGEILLDCMPISTRFDFPPKTKIRIERYVGSTFQKKWDMIVEHDDVEEYVGVSNLCCHRIHLIEPSAITQGMHVDNFSLTYELQDVSLSYRTYNTDVVTLEETKDALEYSNVGWNTPLHPEHLTKFIYGGNKGVLNSFKTSYFYEWQKLKKQERIDLIEKEKQLNSDIEEKDIYYSSVKFLGELAFIKDAIESQTIKFIIPTLMWKGCPNERKFEDLYEVPVYTKIFRTELLKGEKLISTKTLIFSKTTGTIKEKNAEKNSNIHIISNSNRVTIDQSNQVAYCKSIRNIHNELGRNGDGFSNYFKDLVDSTIIGYAQTGFDEKEVIIITPKLTEEEINNGKGYLYEIEISADNGSPLPIYYEHNVLCGSLNGLTNDTIRTVDENTEYADKEKLKIKAHFYIGNNVSEEYPFLVKGVKYSCYDLLRKALLTTDTQIIDNDKTSVDNIEFFLKIDENWQSKLKLTQVYESIFEQKNLWEVLLQIGHYIHAIPYLEFAEGEDRFILNFRQLGGKTKRDDTSTKITIFNSKNLSEYFSQFDSYITNFFSPQNDIEEWLSVKTDDSSYLVSNDTAILKTSYNISEIVEFDIKYNGVTKSALNYIFEKSIYDILTSDCRVSPGKGYSLYYSLGDNIIRGLNYTPPTKDKNGYMALKSIIATLFDNVNRNKLKYNDLLFHIKYKTQDSLRLTQVRPDLENFIKNTSYEKYPHHEQFYGQQDKIVDSEKMSLNLFGKLIQLGNNICQRQESVNIIEDEKEAGDLVNIDNEPYYVTIVENEYYPDATFQKVTYSKNYNQLSQIVTIPSEPRFYEVSERSKIRREVRMMEFFKISNLADSENNDRPRYLNSNSLIEGKFNYNSWASLLIKILFNNEEFKSVNIPNFAFTRFTSDTLRVHKGSNGQILRLNDMYPSIEVERISENIVQPAKSSDHADVLVPLLHYPIHSGIVFEWDMEDNFKAGNCIDTEIKETSNIALGDEAYFAMQSVRYCDIMGRADLFSFKLFSKLDFTQNEIQKLPKGIFIPSDEDSQMYVPNNKYIALDKDGREALSFNYQINLLHLPDLYGDDFVTFPNLFGKKESPLFCALLNKEISLFDNQIDFNNTLISKIDYNTLISTTLDLKDGKDYHSAIEIEFIVPKIIELSLVKSIVFYQESANGVVPFLAKNVANAPNEKKLQSLAIYPVFND